MSIEKINQGDQLTQSMDLVQQNIQRLKELFPEIVTEGKIDFNALQEVLGNELEEGEEYYRFTWAGKAQARREAHKPSTGTLRPSKEESVDWDKTKNLYIEGDNLEVLKLLQKSYANKVKMIYIDPPYNTGNDFVYKDNYKDNLKNYQQISGQIDDEGNKLSTNSESDGRYHSNWLNMMYPRLKLARTLLKEDGLIFMSIDDNEIENLRKLSNEIFGETNFIGQITLLNNPKGRSQDKYIAACHEYILIYSKTLLEKGSLSIAKTEEDIKKDYTLTDNKGLYRELELRNTHREFGKFNRPNLFYPFYVNKNGKVSLEEDHEKHIVLPVWEDGFEGCWTWGIDKSKIQLDELIAKKVKDTWKIYRKAYAIGEDGIATKQLKSIWTEKLFHTEKGQALLNDLFETKVKIFQSPKSLDLIKTMIQMSQTSNDIIIDFFAGSSTTAHATMQLNNEDGYNRKFIQIQLPETIEEKSEAYKAGYKNITEIGKERIRRAGKTIINNKLAELKKLKSKNSLLEEDHEEINNLQSSIDNLDIGFKVFKLDSSNIKGWDGNPEELENSLFDSQDNIKTDRTEEDVLFEILLKYGLDLTLPIEEKLIEGNKVFNVGLGALFICLSDGITSKVAEGVGAWKQELQPEACRVIFKDSGFTDVEKTNSVQILKRFGITEVKSI